MKLSHLLLLPIIACSSPEAEDIPVKIIEWTSGTESFNSTFVREELDSFFIANDTGWTWGNPWYMDEKYAIYEYCFGEFGGGVVIRPLEDDSILYEVQNMNCPFQMEPYRDGYLLAGRLGHLADFSCLLYVEDLSQLTQFTKDDFCDSLPVINQTYYSLYAGSNGDYFGFQQWKRSQAHWYLDTIELSLISMQPKGDDQITIVYSTFGDTTGVFTAQLYANPDSLNRLHHIQLIGSENIYPHRVHTEVVRMNGTLIPITTMRLRLTNDSIEQLELINFGDSVVYIRH